MNELTSAKALATLKTEMAQTVDINMADSPVTNADHFTYEFLQSLVLKDKSFADNLRYLPWANELTFQNIFTDDADVQYPSLPAIRSQRLLVGDRKYTGNYNNQKKEDFVWAYVHKQVDQRFPHLNNVSYSYHNGEKINSSHFPEIRFRNPFKHAQIDQLAHNIRDRLRSLVLFYFLEGGHLDAFPPFHRCVRSFEQTCERAANVAKGTAKQPLRSGKIFHTYTEVKTDQKIETQLVLGAAGQAYLQTANNSSQSSQPLSPEGVFSSTQAQDSDRNTPTALTDATSRSLSVRLAQPAPGVRRSSSPIQTHPRRILTNRLDPFPSPEFEAPRYSSEGNTQSVPRSASVLERTAEKTAHVGIKLEDIEASTTVSNLWSLKRQYESDSAEEGDAPLAKRNETSKSLYQFETLVARVQGKYDERAMPPETDNQDHKIEIANLKAELQKYDQDFMKAKDDAVKRVDYFKERAQKAEEELAEVKRQLESMSDLKENILRLAKKWEGKEEEDRE